MGHGYESPLQISLNADAIEGGKRKADILVPYPSTILLVPSSHTTSVSHPSTREERECMWVYLPLIYDDKVCLTDEAAT